MNNEDSLSNEVVRLELFNILQQFKLFESLDRGRNIVKALQNYERLNCFAHFLNNMSEKACETSTAHELILSVKAVIKYKKQAGLNDRFEYGLKNPSDTRWNSIVTMLTSMWQNWDLLLSVL